MNPVRGGEFRASLELLYLGFLVDSSAPAEGEVLVAVDAGSMGEKPDETRFCEECRWLWRSGLPAGRSVRRCQRGVGLLENRQMVTAASLIPPLIRLYDLLPPNDLLVSPGPSFTVRLVFISK